MDLNTLDLTAKSNEGAWVTLMHPADFTRALDIEFKIVGRDSDHFQAKQAEFERDVMDAVAKGETSTEKRQANSKRLGIKLVAAAVQDWKNVQLDGETLSCSQENVVKVFTRFPWIQEQIDAQVAKRSNFLKP